MRKGILYLFLITYSTVMFKPVLPYVTDLAAHLLFFKDHIQTVHAHHGKFHAHAAVTEGAKNDQSEKSTRNVKKVNVGSDHIITETCLIPIQQFFKIHLYSISIAALNRNIHHDYPPPRV